MGTGISSGSGGVAGVKCRISLVDVGEVKVRTAAAPQSLATFSALLFPGFAELCD